jgi:Tfp pilus assembly protein PilF
VYGIALLACILAGLRELFPRRPAEQVAGLIVAAALPVHLLMYQFVGNDGLAATLSAAAIWILLRGMRTGLMRPGVTAGVGACLGGAMLAKTSALVPTLVIFGTLAAAPLLIRLPIRQWLGGLASAAGIFLLVCGWHYARVAARFGSPLVGNWDRAAWHPWWQDPGYLTPSFYLEFGRSLRQPVMSSVNGLIDGVYATAWGDGQRAGFTELIYAPPWNIDGMGAGYLLALFPSVLMLIGFAVLLNAAVRRGGSNWLVLVLAAASIGAVALWPFRLPIYSVIKASFATPAALAWCALAGAGFGALRRRSRVAGQLASVLLVVWALNAYATHWLPRSDPQVRARIGLQYATVGEHPELAARYLQQALAADPANPNALLGAAILANQAGDLAETEEQLESLLREHPDHAEGHLALAHVLEGTRRPLEALQHYRAAARIRPSFSGAQLGAGRILLGFGRIEEAAVPLQSAIVLLPEQAPQIRATLVSARSRGNDPAETPE